MFELLKQIDKKKEELNRSFEAEKENWAAERNRMVYERDQLELEVRTRFFALLS